MNQKFRGLSIDEKSKGEWQYGYLIEDGGQAFIINEVIEANEQYITIGSWCPIDKNTVSQSTGVMNLRQKRKHFRYYLITFTIKTFGMDNIFTEEIGSIYNFYNALEKLSA